MDGQFSPGQPIQFEDTGGFPLRNPATRAYITNAYVAGSTSSRTFSGVTLGTGYTHYAVAIYTYGGNGATITHSTLTVDGQSAAKLVEAPRTFLTVSLWIVQHSVASGNIVAAFSAASVSSQVAAVWGINNLQSTTPLSTNSDTDTTSPLVLSLATTTPDGFIVGAGAIWNDAGTHDFTGEFTVEDFDRNSHAADLWAAGISGVPAGGAVTLGYHDADQFIAGVSVALR